MERRYDKPISSECIETLEQLLMEYQTSGQAIASFNQLIHLNLYDPDSWNRRGNALRNLRRYEEVIASYQQSLGISRQIGDRHHEAVSLFNLANTFSKLDRKQEALQFYQNTRQVFQAIGSE